MAPSRPDLRLVRSVQEETAAASLAVARDDAQLVAAIRSGDPAAAAAFYDRVHRQVDRTLYRLLGQRDSDHADLAQTAFVELVKTIGRFRGECALDSWVCTVTAHVVYKHLRQRQAERRLFEHLVADDDMPSVPVRAGREAAARDLLRRIGRHLARIDEGQSWAFVLHDVFGCDVREVARVLGISESAAQSRLVRGRKRLHDRISADPELAPLLLRLEGSS